MDPNIAPVRLTFALKALGIHFAVSCTLALSIAWVVFSYWIPSPYGGLVRAPQLFLVLLAVDVVCGPLLTAILANPEKSRRELSLDFSLVILLQLGALIYGLHTIANARPVALVFESDRFVVVSAAQIDTKALQHAPEDFQQLSWRGPKLMGVRAPKGGEETLKSIELSAQGLEPSARPGWWQSYESSRSQVVQRMLPIETLRQRKDADQRQVIDKALRAQAQAAEQAFYLPLVSSHQLDSWIVILDAQANIVGYVPVGGFE